MLVKCIIVKSMLCTIVILSFQVLRRKRKAGAVVAQGVGPPRNKVWVENPGFGGLPDRPGDPLCRPQVTVTLGTLLMTLEIPDRQRVSPLLVETSNEMNFDTAGPMWMELHAFFENSCPSMEISAIYG